MLTALTRAVSPTLEACQLTWVPRQKIDIALAERQHHAYEGALAELGLRVISLPAEPGLPDATFVEDPIVVFEEVALINRMGAPARRPESESLAIALEPFRPLHRMREPATLEGGDVMRIGRDLFVGLSCRTNRKGIAELEAATQVFGYRVHAIEVHECLHLKSACCSLGDGRILANPDWLDTDVLGEFRIIPVPKDEPAAANVLRIRDTILMAAGFPGTEALLRREGFGVKTIDISELMKAEAAITCSSVIFDDGHAAL